MMIMRFFVLFAVLFWGTINAWAQNINLEEAYLLSKPAQCCIQKVYPYKTSYVLNNETEVMPHRDRHPAFFGCYDWHSSVHGHWTLVRLLKSFPDLPNADTLRIMLETNISYENIQKEIELFSSPGNGSFERTYGWAWLLKLSLELQTWNDPLGKRLVRNLQPLADSIVCKYKQFLPKLNYPIRVGEHSNTAFGLSFAWDYACANGDYVLRNLIEDKAIQFYKKDVSCPLSWEPGGFDFLSPCLIEADLMSRVLDPCEFAHWMDKFIPDLGDKIIVSPVEVSDRSDGKLVHLDGLNFSRTWCLLNISKKLPKQKDEIARMALDHLEKAMPHISSGAYEGEHWLATFALYALICAE